MAGATNLMQRCSEIARRMMRVSNSTNTTRVPIPILMPPMMHLPSPLSSSSSVSLGCVMSSGEMVECGRGDKKTKRGKRFKGSFGNSRPKRKHMIDRFKDKVEVPRSTPWPLPFKLI